MTSRSRTWDRRGANQADLHDGRKPGDRQSIDGENDLTKRRDPELRLQMLPTD